MPRRRRSGRAEASYHLDLREWVLPYEAVRTRADPDAMLLEFLQSTYDVAADLGGWDRARSSADKERIGEDTWRAATT